MILPCVRKHTRLIWLLLAAVLIATTLVACNTNANVQSASRETETTHVAISADAESFATSPNDRGIAENPKSQKENEEAEEAPVEEIPIDTDLLVALIGEEEAGKLIEGAKTNRDRQWIAANPGALGIDGETVQWKLLTLAANEDNAVPFVRHFPDSYPAETATGNTESGIANDSRVPHFYQWDQRWGYTVYCSTAFGLTGCGPTAFAMVYQGVTGNHDHSPYDMGLLAQDMGHMARFDGTSTSFLYDASASFGIDCTSIPANYDSLVEALDNGAVLIANVGQGYFSHFDGHYLVLTGINPNGELVLNDPYSAANSQQAWDIDFILSQTKVLYAFTQKANTSE